MNRFTLSHRKLSVLAALALLTGCATQTSRLDEARFSDDWHTAARALNAQHWAEARVPLARLLQQDLRNGHLQFLHALGTEQQARAGDRALLEQAAVGYANAARFAPGHYWALLHWGFLDLENGEYAAAQARFAEAAMDQPQRWEAFYGLGVASYYRHDLPLLHLAAQRVHRLAPDDVDGLRLLALASAFEQDGQALQLAQRAAERDTENARSHFLRRVAEIGRGHAYSTADFFETDRPQVAAPSPLPPNQVIVEVTILLSSILDQSVRGVNLFDGLRVLYGYSNTLQQVAGNFGRETQRSITSQISSPQLDYSLNLFNDSGQYYSVVARPSITAHLGRQSQFFAGRTLNVEVSGVNLGQLQPIDVGVQLRVTPEQIDADKVTFQVAAERSFLSQDQIGSFERSLTTFRQAVSATADIAFGQTLVLSALSEQVSDRAFSKVPIAGEVPVLNWFTRRNNDARRQESLLILVTPKLPLSFSTPDDPARRERAVQQLLEVWSQRIDPRTDIPAVLDRLKHSRWLRPPKAGDLRTRLPQAAEWRSEAIAESLLLARR